MAVDKLQRNMTVEQLRHQIIESLPVVRVSVDQFPSGTVFIDVEYGERALVVELSARCEAVGVSELTHRIPMDWSGHDAVFETLDQAAEHLFSLLNIAREPVSTAPRSDREA